MNLDDAEKTLKALETRIAAADKRFEEYAKKNIELAKVLENALAEAKVLKKDAEFGQRVREVFKDMLPNPSVSSGAVGTLTDVKTLIQVGEDVRKIGPFETTTCRGRLLKLMQEGFFDQNQTIATIMEAFPRRGWSDEQKTVQNTIAEMFNDGQIAKSRSDEKQAWKYSKPAGVMFA